MKTGRNDPCPCGSGKKYKSCCIDRQEAVHAPGAEEMKDDIRKLFAMHKPDSLEEAQALVGQYMRQRNRLPQTDFQGLSPEQMRNFLYHPFESPHLVTFPTCLPAPPEAPILILFELMANAIGDKGMKPTATGNLPRNFCREAALAFWGEEKYLKITRYGNINMETDFRDLNAARIVAEQAALIRKSRGRFVLSSKCRKIIASQGLAGIYPLLLKAYLRDFNWAYRDGYPDFDLIQASFLFTLYLLDRYGDQWRPNVFYEDCFLRAFPRILDEVTSQSYFPPEDMVRRCYSWRCLESFAEFMGLAGIEKESDSSLETRFSLKKRPLLGECVIFRI